VVAPEEKKGKGEEEEDGEEVRKERRGRRLVSNL
jgi:hypothetical protein